MDLESKLRAVGYEARRAEILALRACEVSEDDGIQAFLLEGPPGCGKSALAAAYAKASDATFVYALLHSWSDDQELFRGVDVCAAVAGDAAHVEQPGVLAVAARASHAGRTVLCLDEIDKCQERTESLLLDVLQSGRVPIRPGEHLQADMRRLVVFITSNGQRALGDAFLRRVRRVRMSPLPVATLDALVVRRAQVPVSIAKLASKAARRLAQEEGNPALSMQEIAHFAGDSFRVAQSVEDVQSFLAQWAARSLDGNNRARKADVQALWGEIVAHRRRSNG